MTPGPTDPHPLVRIHYLRPPDRLEVFEQRTLASDASVIVTFAEAMHRAPAMELEGEVVLESGSDVVWFTFPDEWHDIGRFHTADGVFKGFYANILTPPEIRPDHVWHTTDSLPRCVAEPGPSAPAFGRGPARRRGGRGMGRPRDGAARTAGSRTNRGRGRARILASTSGPRVDPRTRARDPRAGLVSTGARPTAWRR